MPHSPLFLGVLVLAVACGGNVTSADTQPAETGGTSASTVDSAVVGGESGAPVAVEGVGGMVEGVGGMVEGVGGMVEGDAGAVNGEGGVAESGGASSSGAGGLGVGGMPELPEPPEEIPARQSVVFRITNTGETVRYLSRGGYSCSAWRLSYLDGTLPGDRAPGYQCGCECPPPPSSAVAGYAILSPGEAIDFTWDGRVEIWYLAYYRDCSYYVGNRTYPMYSSVAQPAPAGRYTVTVGVDDTVPSTCSATEESVTCPSAMYGSALGEVSCSRPSPITTTFELPESGDIVVPISI